MPQEVSKSVWICPRCSAYFDTQEQADDHIFEAHTESPILKRETFYLCDMCGRQFPSPSFALDCEFLHRERADTHFFDWESRQEKEKLKAAADKPGQRRLL